MNNYITIAVDPATQKIITMYIDDSVELRNSVADNPSIFKKIMNVGVIEQIMTYFSQRQNSKTFDDLYIQNNGASVLRKPNIALIKKHQISILYNICNAKCNEGFSSSATGALYKYPTQIIDQQNLQASTLAAMTSTDANWVALLWCSENDAWDMRPHNAQQVIAVNTDCRNFIESTRAKLHNIVVKINEVSDDPSIENATKIQSMYW
jgi:hypothetical protein